MKAPEVFFRSCVECKKYLYDSKGIVKDVADRRIERGKNQQPKCEFCEKYDKETKQVWDGFIPKNTYYFRTFLIARAFGALPCPGGIDQQLPATLDILIMLNEIFTGEKDLESKEFQLKLLGIVGGGKWPLKM